MVPVMFAVRAKVLGTEPLVKSFGLVGAVKSPPGSLSVQRFVQSDPEPLMFPAAEVPLLIRLAPPLA